MVLQYVTVMLIDGCVPCDCRSPGPSHSFQSLLLGESASMCYQYQSANADDVHGQSATADQKFFQDLLVRLSAAPVSDLCYEIINQACNLLHSLGAIAYLLQFLCISHSSWPSPCCSYFLSVNTECLLNSQYSNGLMPFRNVAQQRCF